MFKLAVKMMGIKKMTSLPEEELIQMSRKMQAESAFQMPANDAEYTYKDHLFMEKFHAVQIKPQNTSGKKAVLYLYGGGMMTPPPKRYFEYAKKMARLTGRDVWYVYYPLCADYTIKDAVLMVHDVYEKMLTVYEAENIAFYGFSSGGGLLAYMMMYNQTLENPLPKPEVYIGIAPGGCPADEKEYQAMLALNDKDIEVDAEFMRNMRKIMSKKEAVPEYMLSGAGGDYSGFPETWLYYGADEILSVKAPMYKANLDAAGVKNHIFIREKMCHCYCIDIKFPEAKEDYNAIIDLLKG